jgi:hypothetical protein
MIIVVEGISAAGKTTWCRRHAYGVFVPETVRCADPPDAETEPEAAARFWVAHGARRWADAVTMARTKGLAVCDTDPLKLHYAWSLWRIGMASERYWQAACAATRHAIAHERLGFAAFYFVSSIDPILARQRRDADGTRSRRNFELHVKLHTPLTAWYRAIAQVLPGRVVWALPDDGLVGLPAQRRQPTGVALEIFDQVIQHVVAGWVTRRHPARAEIR